MGVCVPEELGGAGADFLAYILVLEELSRADAGVGVTVAVHTSAATLRSSSSAPRSSAGGSSRTWRPPCARRVRADRARIRLGCGRAPVVRGAGRRRLEDRRRETVDHERQPRRHLPRLRAHGSGHRRNPWCERLPPRRHGRRGDPRGGEARAELVLDGGHPLRGSVRGRDRLLHEENRGFTVAMATLDGGRIGIARRRSESRRPPTTWPGPMRSSATSSARGSRTSRRSSSSSPTWRPRSRPPACSPIAPPGSSSRGSLTPPRARRRSCSRRRSPGGRRARRSRCSAVRLHEGVPRRALLPRCEGHRDLRGNERDPAHRDRPEHPRPPRRAAPDAWVGWRHVACRRRARAPHTHLHARR